MVYAGKYNNYFLFIDVVVFAKFISLYSEMIKRDVQV